MAKYSTLLLLFTYFKQLVCFHLSCRHIWSDVNRKNEISTSIVNKMSSRDYFTNSVQPLEDDIDELIMTQVLSSQFDDKLLQGCLQGICQSHNIKSWSAVMDILSKSNACTVNITIAAVTQPSAELPSSVNYNIRYKINSNLVLMPTLMLKVTSIKNILMWMQALEDELKKVELLIVEQDGDFNLFDSGVELLDITGDHSDIHNFRSFNTLILKSMSFLRVYDLGAEPPLPPEYSTTLNRYIEWTQLNTANHSLINSFAHFLKHCKRQSQREEYCPTDADSLPILLWFASASLASLGNMLSSLLQQVQMDLKFYEGLINVLDAAGETVAIDFEENSNLTPTVMWDERQQSLRLRDGTLCDLTETEIQVQGVPEALSDADKLQFVEKYFPRWEENSTRDGDDYEGNIDANDTQTTAGDPSRSDSRGDGSWAGVDMKPGQRWFRGTEETRDQTQAAPGAMRQRPSVGLLDPPRDALPPARGGTGDGNDDRADDDDETLRPREENEEIDFVDSLVSVYQQLGPDCKLRVVGRPRIEDGKVYYCISGKSLRRGEAMGSQKCFWVPADVVVRELLSRREVLGVNSDPLGSEGYGTDADPEEREELLVTAPPLTLFPVESEDEGPWVCDNPFDKH